MTYSPTKQGAFIEQSRGQNFVSPWLVPVVAASLIGAVFTAFAAPQGVIGTAASVTWLCLPFMALPFSMRRGVSGVAHPWTVIFGLFVYSWVLRLTLTSMDRGGADAVKIMFGSASHEIIFGGLFLGGYGLAFFTAGYFLTSGLPAPPVAKRRFASWYRLDDQGSWRPRRMEFAAVVVLLISLVGLILLQRSSGGELLGKRFNELQGGSASRTSSITYGYLRVAYFSHAVFMVLLIYRLKFGRLPSPLLRALLPLAGILAILVPLLGNNRAGVALILVDFLILQVVLSRRIPHLRIVVFAATAVLVLAWMLSLRGAGTRTLNEALISTFAGRDLFDVGKLSHIYGQSAGSLDGQTLWGWLIFLVPESMLPFDKPMWTGLGQYVWQNAYDGVGVTGVPAGLIGELYLNLGLAGVAAGMTLFGVLIAAVYRTIYPVLLEGRVIGAVLFGIELVRLIMFGLSNDLGTGILSSLSDLLPILLLMAFVAPRAPFQKSGPTTGAYHQSGADGHAERAG